MRPEALESLGLQSEDWGPCYSDEFSHADFSDNWRGSVPCPNESEINGVVLSEPVPSEVTMRQARLQLLEDGVYDTVNNAVPTIGMSAQIEWEYASVIERANPLIPAIQVLLSWSDERADTFFREAAKQ